MGVRGGVANGFIVILCCSILLKYDIFYGSESFYLSFAYAFPDRKTQGPKDKENSHVRQMGLNEMELLPFVLY